MIAVWLVFLDAEGANGWPSFVEPDPRSGRRNPLTESGNNLPIPTPRVRVRVRVARDEH